MACKMNFLKYGEQKIIKGQLFTFNNPDTGAINLFLKNDTVECNSQTMKFLQ